jgi:5-formyltetrahydrofolate cyclo-ligase
VTTPPPESVAAKAALRVSLRQALAEVTEQQALEGAERLCWNIAASEIWRSARTVMMFAPVPGEPNLRPLAVEILRAGRLCLPRVDWMEKRMVAAAVRDLDRDLILRRNNIREPLPDCPEVPPAEIDLVLVPGLGFDRSGRRLGRGGGFYDRFLSEPTLRATRCGVLFDTQLVEAIPAESHDVMVEYLATPSQLWKA